VLVHLQPMLAWLDTEAFEVEIGDARVASHGQQEPFGVQDVAVIQRQRDARSRRAGANRRGPEADIDAIVAQGIGQDPGDRRLLARQEVRGRLHDGDRRAERGVDLRQFAADRATPEHDQRGGPVRRGQRLIAGPGRHPLQSLDRRHHRCRAGRDHQFGVADLALPDRDHPRPYDPAPPAQESYPLLAELPHAERVVIGYDLVPPSRREGVGRAPIPRIERPGDRTKSLGLAQQQSHLGGAQQDLARDAGDEAALAADPQFLDDRDRAATVGQLVRQVLAGTPRAEDHDVESLHQCAFRFALLVSSPRRAPRARACR